MKKSAHKSAMIRKLLNVLIILFLLSGLIRAGYIISANLSSYTSPYYDEKVYKSLENAFNNSQYRLKNNTAVIPDETVFSYAAGAYLRGVDPILINSEHTPLGKYFLSLSIFFFKNDKLIIIPFALLTLFALWLLAKQVLHNRVLALIPVAFLSTEQLFINQLAIVPLLDIIQLPFILLTLCFFISEKKTDKYWLTAVFLGFTAATKSVTMSILLIGTFILYFLIVRKFRSVINLLLYLPLSGIVLVLSYTRTFMDGYNFYQFLGFQKWIILYQKSKLLFPFSVWRLVFLNEWQAWWGNFGILKADDWSVTWPIFCGLAFLLIILLFLKKYKSSDEIIILCLWFIVYGGFLSLGVVSSRFLLPLLPAAYILGTYLVVTIIWKKVKI